MDTSPKILLVEDDRHITTALTHALRSSYEIVVCEKGKLALYQADIIKFDLVILDINGLDVCQKLRERGIKVPILILSGESTVHIKISLLDNGADDYLTKPFSLGELQARLRSLLRIRSSAAVWPASTLKVADITLNRRNFSVSRTDQEINLRRKEFEILECLMEHPDQVVTRQQLISRVWNGQNEPWNNTLDVHIKYLRDKLDKPFKQQLISTVHGRGYKLNMPVQEPASK
jgi:DNA-binding response OmpR family regulator